MSYASASLTYRRAVTEQASSVGLVIALFDTLVSDLQSAVAAMRRPELGAIEERSNRLKHALQVLGQLNALLDMANGGGCAENLARFYEHLRRRLLLAQFRKDPSILESAVRNIFQVRAALQQVDSRSTQPEGNPASPANGRLAGRAPDAEAGPKAQGDRLPFSCSA